MATRSQLQQYINRAKALRLHILAEMREYEELKEAIKHLTPKEGFQTSILEDEDFDTESKELTWEERRTLYDQHKPRYKHHYTPEMLTRALNKYNDKAKNKTKLLLKKFADNPDVQKIMDKSLDEQNKFFSDRGLVARLKDIHYLNYGNEVDIRNSIKLLNKVNTDKRRIAARRGLSKLVGWDAAANGTRDAVLRERLMQLSASDWESMAMNLGPAIKMAYAVYHEVAHDDETYATIQHLADEMRKFMDPNKKLKQQVLF